MKGVLFSGVGKHNEYNPNLIETVCEKRREKSQVVLTLWKISETAVLRQQNRVKKHIGEFLQQSEEPVGNMNNSPHRCTRGKKVKHLENKRDGRFTQKKGGKSKGMFVCSWAGGKGRGGAGGKDKQEPKEL